MDTAPVVGATPPSSSLRRATPAAADRLAAAVVAEYAGYRAFAPAGWAPPTVEEEAAETRAKLGHPDVWCVYAVDGDGAITGQVTVLPVTRHSRPSEEPGLAHLANLFVREDRWGTGLARDLLAAAVARARQGGFTQMRLFVAAAHARARRFYERDGWRPAGEAFLDDRAGLEIVEYRRPL
ncbi:MAG TPA: GNAT family N-acetyltransferase [Solirubrobacteraceae bacterium]|jgi:GNAT superfamily N-acetyltransferase